MTIRIREPVSVSYSEKNEGVVEVCLVIPDLDVKKKLFGEAVVKDGKVSVDFHEWGFEMFAVIREVLAYSFRVKKLPGKIDVGKCSVKYESQLVKIYLVKQEKTTWIPILHDKGSVILD